MHLPRPRHARHLPDRTGAGERSAPIMRQLLAVAAALLVLAASVAVTDSTADAAQTYRVGDQARFADNSAAAGVKVDLFRSQNGRRTSFIGSTTTSISGSYRFDVSDGCYAVVFVAPNGATFTDGEDDPWDERHFCLNGRDRTDIDTTLHRLDSDQLVGQVWRVAGDVVDQPGDIQVDLFRSTNGRRAAFIESTRTARGSYVFDDVEPGCYAIVVVAPTGYTFSPGDNDVWDEQHKCIEAFLAPAFVSTLHKLAGPSDPDCFTPAFRDDFDGNSIDRSEWTLYGPYPGNAGFGVRHPNTISIADGTLNIRASMIDGVLHSGGMKHEGVTQRYGYYEVRVRVDADPSRATSGVVLTWPENNDNPAGGENNIFETHETFNGRPAGDPDRAPVTSFMHYPVSQGGQLVDRHVSRVHEGSDGKVWAIYSMEWTPGRIVYSHNGRAVEPILGDIIPTHRHNLTIQLDAWSNEMGGPVDMEVDYVEIHSYTCG